MESQNSVMLETCGEDSMLIQTVKSIVRQKLVRNELEGEEEGFFVITDVRSDESNHLEASNEESNVNQTEERATWSDLCRVCANVNDHLIPIFDGEGLQHELCNKIHKYLPIHVSETDTLPLQLCYHCAATILAWHELSEGCLNAERRLMEMQDTLQEKQQYFNTSSSDALEATTQDTVPASTVVESLPQQQPIVKDEVCGEEAINGSERCKSQITENRSVSFSNYQKACRVFLRAYNEQIKARASRSMRAINQKEKDNLSIKDAHTKDLSDQLVTQSNSKTSSLYLRHNSALEDAEINNEKENKSVDRQDHSKKHTASHRGNLRSKENQSSACNTKFRKLLPANYQPTSSIDCKLCSKKFRLQVSYRTHMRKHTGEKPYTCHICGKQFGLNGSLYYHLKHVHSGIKNHSCDICGRSFAMKAAMEDHRRIHTGERPFVCDACGKSFKSKASLYIHNRTHTNEYPHKCTYCTKTFRWKQQMLGHLTIHTGEKNHTCDVCGKGFGVKNNLNRHKRTHSEEKPYTCEQCGLCFRQKRYLNSHQRTRHK